MQVKICTKCKRKLLAIIKYFYKDNRAKSGLMSWCKECHRKYWQSKKGKKIQKKHRQLEKRKEYQKEYKQSEKYKEYQKLYQKEYRQSEKGKEAQKKADKKYYENSKLSKCISRSIRYSLNGNKNGCHWEDLVSYTLEKLKKHLEYLFQSRMTWDNYGKWHIDHIRPISSFNITSYNCKDFQECWALENLQPLWAKDNLNKGARWDQ